MARPGGNVTGLSYQSTDLAGKRLELLREVVPGLRRVAIVADAGNPSSVRELDEVQATARSLGLDVTRLEVRRAEDIAPAIEPLKGRADALYVCTGALLFNERDRINALVAAARLPTIYVIREYVDVGGLLSYGTNYSGLFRRAGEYVDKILRGAKPADLPVERPTSSSW